MNEYLVALFQQQWREDPQSRVFLRLAEEYRKGELYGKAVEVCRQGIEHHPEYVPALVCLGRCELAQGHVAEAEQAFEKVRGLAPDNPHALRGLGQIYLETERLEEAQTLFEVLALQDPSDALVQETLDALRHRDEPEADSESAADPELIVEPSDEPLDEPPEELSVEASEALTESSAEPPAEFSTESSTEPEPVEEPEEPALLLEEELAEPEEVVESPEPAVPPPSAREERLDAEFDLALNRSSQDTTTILDEKDADEFEEDSPQKRKIRTLNQWLAKIKGNQNV